VTDETSIENEEEPESEIENESESGRGREAVITTGTDEGTAEMIVTVDNCHVIYPVQTCEKQNAPLFHEILACCGDG
jgi:hypothetical protein